MSVRCRSRLGQLLFRFSVVLTFLVSADKALAQVLPTNVDLTPSDPIADMHLMTASSGWVSRLRHVLWTNDAGRSWGDITPPLKAGQEIGGAYFLDRDHGWALLLQGDETGILRPISMAATTDEGKS